eukprot:TRINITY_DN1160_c0_g1_i8.p2 TRINITY_DN1160_c0_g1~~TRINITY_DN1160_c0_g1_i8.p2  ORF type:complete len:199 (+),score=7.75 TRINITY_DN1160_c0_g1_i8:260-856(+)
MTPKIQDTPSRAAFDVKSAQDLRSQFQKDPQQGLKLAAQQFETLFLQQVIKSMRDATPQDGLMNSDSSRFYTGLLDQQMAQNLATNGKGIGFAQLIEKQLGRNMSNAAGQAALNAPANAAALPLAGSDVHHLQYTPVPSSLPTSAAYEAINAEIASEYKKRKTNAVLIESGHGLHQMPITVILLSKWGVFLEGLSMIR